MFAMNRSDPLPFKQPFVELHLVGERPDGKPEYRHYLIDVDGRSDLFVRYEEDLTPKPTDLFLRLCRLIETKISFHVHRFGLYVGSAGPSHVYRYGILFSRMEELERGFPYKFEEDDPDPDGETIEIELPVPDGMLCPFDFLGERIVFTHPGHPRYPESATEALVKVILGPANEE